MTASDKCTNQIKNVLLCRSHPHRTFAALNTEVCWATFLLFAPDA